MLRLGFLEASRTAILACDVQETFRKSMTNFNNLILVSNRMVCQITKTLYNYTEKNIYNYFLFEYINENSNHFRRLQQKF